MARQTLLSPARYQRMGYALALPTGYTLSQLRSALIRAQDEVNRYCAVPKVPQAFDWRGGTMTDERHQWKMVNPLAYGPGAKRVFTNVSPIKNVAALQLDLGRTYSVVLDPATDVYINSIESYVEIVALNPTIVGFWPLAASLGLYNPVARITYDYGWTFAVVGDVLEAESPTVFSAAYGNWDPTVVPVVSVAGSELDPGDYTINYDDGTVTLDTAPVAGEDVTVDYTYTVPAEIVDAIGITATAGLVKSRMNQRGMAGLSSLRVAEVSMTQMSPSQMMGGGVSRNGVTIPVDAASLLDGYAFGTAAA